MLDKSSCRNPHNRHKPLLLKTSKETKNIAIYGTAHKQVYTHVYDTRACSQIKLSGPVEAHV